MQRADGYANQAMVWLAGLAATLLVLAVATPVRMKMIIGDDYHVATVLLVISITCAVIHRAMFPWVRRGYGMQVLALFGHVTGYSAHSIELPDELSSRWDRQEIVARLRAYFDLDSEWLIARNVSIDQCREVYISSYASWKRSDDDRLATLSRAAGASSVPEGTDNLGAIRRQARRIRNIRRVRNGCFSMAAVSFVVVIVMVAHALWISSSLMRS